MAQKDSFRTATVTCRSASLARLLYQNLSAGCYAELTIYYDLFTSRDSRLDNDQIPLPLAQRHSALLRG